MKLTIFGATGRVGSRLAYLALEAGHKVSVFVRDRSRLTLTSENLEVYEGELDDEAQVLEACTGAEVLFSALGGSMKESPVHAGKRIAALLTAINKLTIRRVLAIGVIGILQSSDDELIKDTADYPSEFQNVADVHLETYRRLVSSGLDWTLPCPPNIIDKELTAEYRVQKDFALKNCKEIGTNDLAHFMLHEATANKYLSSRVSIGY